MVLTTGPRLKLWKSMSTHFSSSNSLLDIGFTFIDHVSLKTTIDRFQSSIPEFLWSFKYRYLYIIEVHVYHWNPRTIFHRYISIIRISLHFKVFNPKISLHFKVFNPRISIHFKVFNPFQSQNFEPLQSTSENFYPLQSTSIHFNPLPQNVFDHSNIDMFISLKYVFLYFNPLPQNFYNGIWMGFIYPIIPFFNGFTMVYYGLVV